MELITKHKKLLKTLCEKHKVKKLYVFGSVNTNSFKNGSDIDFLVQFGDVDLTDYFDNYLEFKESLEELFHRKVDLVEIQTIKNPILKKSINQSKKIIYGSTDSVVAV